MLRQLDWCAAFTAPPVCVLSVLFLAWWCFFFFFLVTFLHISISINVSFFFFLTKCVSFNIFPGDALKSLIPVRTWHLGTFFRNYNVCIYLKNIKLTTISCCVSVAPNKTQQQQTCHMLSGLHVTLSFCQHMIMPLSKYFHLLIVI